MINLINLSFNKSLKPFFPLLIAILFLISCCPENLQEKSKITERYANGKKKILCTYRGKGELEVLIEKITYNEKGQAISQEFPEERIIKLYTWHSNGNRRSEIIYKNGFKNGNCLGWNRLGQIKRESLYKDDLLVRIVEYQKNRRVEKVYKMGELFISREYNDGILVTQMTLDDKGKLIKAVYRYPDGQISDEREYKDGKKNGWWTYWDKNGRLVNRTFFKDDQPVEFNSKQTSQNKF